MANIREYKGVTPTIHETVYVDESALVIGDVTIGAESSVWPMVVIRGDMQSISIGHHTNIQDGSVLHITHDHDKVPGGLPLIIGNGVTVGHKALLHACTIGDHCLIGMSATVMDGAIVQDDVVVAAGSLVTPGKVLESGYLYAGSPARKIRALKESEIEYQRYAATQYSKLKDDYKADQ